MIGSLFSLIILGAIAFGIYSAVRATTGASSDRPFDSAEAAKSFGIHLGLFAAMIALTSAFTDILQEVLAPTRLTDTNSDLARALSLFIVGVPVYGLLLRAVRSRYRERAATGDERPHRGWTVYLVGALTTTLIVVLVSVGQILADAHSERDSVESDEVAQLIIWALAWAIHWFVLRPRFRVIGDAHLAIGALIGLAWMSAGSVAIATRILEAAYAAIFGDTLNEWDRFTVWVWIAIVGAVVWGWHWLANFSRAGSVEGDRRSSFLWNFTVIIGAILPALIMAISVVGWSIVGILVWFFGTTREDAVDYFDAAPGSVALFFVAFVVWAYHRWVLGTDGPKTRTESLRLHDYCILAFSLLGIVIAVAVLMNVMFDLIVAPTAIAGNLNLDNTMIITVSALLICVGVWWYQWAEVERARRLVPIAESDSTWRKIYLGLAFGIGGLILAVSAVWALFSFIQDLLDGELGRSTFRALSAPLGWGIAVIGAVWYHRDIWQVDRETLLAHAAAQPVAAAAVQPPPPSAAAVQLSTALPGATAEFPTTEFPTTMPVATGPAISATPTGPSWATGVPATAESPAVMPAVTPAPGVTLRLATPEDFGEVFALQRAAFVEEAIAYGTVDVPSLTETLDQLRQRMTQSSNMVAVDNGRIVGSVSLRRYREGGADIERLMVAPDRRREGISALLLDALEKSLRDQGEPAVQLIVGEILAGNRALYDGRGYEFVSREQAPGGPALLTVRKQLQADRA